MTKHPNALCLSWKGEVTSKICPQTSDKGPAQYPHAKFQLGASKRDKTHSRSYIQTDSHTDSIISIDVWV